MIMFLKRNLCFLPFALLVLAVLCIMANAIHEGICRIITDQQIEDTYRIHK